jgi:hypothetical protein
MKRDISLIRLSRDHQRGLALAKRIDDVLGGIDGVSVADVTSETLDMWEQGLVPHFRAECECLLARFARKSGTDDDLVARTQQDHLQAHALVTSIREAESEPGRRDHLAALATLLREHIRWEEAVLFEAAQSVLSDELIPLGEDLAQRLPEIPPAPAWYPTR